MIFSKISVNQKYNQIAVFTVKSFVGSMILAVSAQIAIPMPLVPITGQTLGLIAVAYFMGARAGVVSVIMYLLEGIAGMPVFANASFGLLVLLGTSGGYLFGFIPAVAVMGYLFKKTSINSFIIMMLGQMIVLGFGVVQLSFFIPQDQLLVVGLYPFLAGSVVKSVLASFAIVLKK